MAKVTILSRQFLKGHFLAGKKTYFVEKVLAGVAYYERLDATTLPICTNIDFEEVGVEERIVKLYRDTPKLHTIRGGNRWKEGDALSLRYWTGKPYRSPQMEVYLTTIKQVFTFKAYWERVVFKVELNGVLLEYDKEREIAQNDGLTYEAFINWFRFTTRDLPFEGQLISWVDKDFNYINSKDK